MAFVVSAKNRISNDEKYSSAERVQHRFRNPQAAHKAEMLLHAAEHMSSQNGIAAFATNALAGRKRTSAEIAIHIGLTGRD
jgi:hypothetical protein